MGCLKDASKETLTCNYINFVCATEISSYIHTQSETLKVEVFIFKQWILIEPINQLSPIINDNLTSDKILAHT